MLQNHLTEMATLVVRQCNKGFWVALVPVLALCLCFVIQAMELTSDAEAFDSAKMDVLKAMQTSSAHESVIGQYEKYKAHVRISFNCCYFVGDTMV